MLFISMNGPHARYFSCMIGVRHGDPFSLLLLCLVKDVLSRGISNLVAQGSLKLIKGPRGVVVHSRIFYVYNIIIFCNCNNSNMKVLI